MTVGVTAITVEDDDALDDVLARVREAGGSGHIALVIPTGSSLFLSAAEFRLFKDAVDRSRIPVTVHSADSLRLQLARMLGFDTVAAPPPKPFRPAPPPPSPLAPPLPDRPPASPPSAARDASPIAAAVPPPSSTNPPPPPPPAPPPDLSDEAVTPPAAPPAAPPSADESSAGRFPTPQTGVVTSTPPNGSPAPANPEATAGPEESSADVTNPADHWPEVPPSVESAAAPTPRRRLVPRSRIARPRLIRARPVPAVTPTATPVGDAGGVDDGIGDSFEPGDAPQGIGQDAPKRFHLPIPDAWRQRLSPRSLPVLIAIAIAAIALIAVVVTLLLPRADVRVVLKSEPVHAELVYDVTADGDPLGTGADQVVAGEPLTLDVVYQGSIPTTGSRSEPDQTAAGTVRLANPTGEEQTVQAGTTVSTEQGVEFAFAADVKVPAADPATGRAGSATAKVSAVKPGGRGNVETGALGGRLPNGVFYSNRDGPTEGGTDRKIRIVAPEDLEKLRQQAAATLPSLAAQTFAKKQTAGAVALPGSFKIGKGSDRFDHKAGDEAAAISLQATRPVTALTYDPTSVLAHAQDTLRDRLAAATSDGYAVDPSSIRITTPTAAKEEATGTRFQLLADAQARAVLDDDQRRELASRLAGKDQAETETILRAESAIDRFEISYRPAWMPDRMPSDAGRIKIEPES
jgi:hypothetical protein